MVVVVVLDFVCLQYAFFMRPSTAAAGRGQMEGAMAADGAAAEAIQAEGTAFVPSRLVELCIEEGQ